MKPSNDIDGGNGYMSIGELAGKTGISADTIRMWERRYGRPEPVRLASGHRRYGTAHVRWLRRVAEAMALGHRPSGVVHLDEDRLDDLLYPRAARLDQSGKLQKIIDLVRNYEGDEVARELRRMEAELGANRFVTQCLGPLLAMVGRAWADGRLEIRHEHYLSELLEDLMRSMRMKLPRPDSRVLVILTTLPGETHGLGLQIASVMCTLAGVRAEILGVNSPIEEIVAAVNETKAAGVALSVSLATGGVQTDRTVAALRRALPSHVRLAVGGQGARHVRRGPRGVDYVLDQAALDRWLSGLQPWS